MHGVTGPQAWRTDPAVPDPAVPDHAAALARADRILVTAHPTEPISAVALRAGEGALECYVDRARGGRPPHVAPRPPDVLGPAPDHVPVEPDGPEAVAVEPLRRLLTRHLRERLADDDAGELHAAVTAAAVVAALDLALRHWLAGGGRAEGIAACRARLRAVAPLLPPGP